MIEFYTQIYGNDGWGNMSKLGPNYQAGTVDIFKRDKVDEFNSASTAYHDRLGEFDKEKHEKACKEARIDQNIIGATLGQIDVFLTSYFGYPCRVYFVELQRAMNGYDYIRMDYQFNESKEQNNG
jgi:hypothetical protein